MAYTGVITLKSKDIVDVFYPVGTIYETVDSTFNPSTQWGGTWERITDKFLVASGSTYSGTGGSASSSITLKIENLPSHNHTFTGSAVTSGAGSAHSHTRGNMNITGQFFAAPFGISDGTQDGNTFGCFMGGGSVSGTLRSGSDYQRSKIKFDASKNWTGSTSEESSHTHSVTASGSIGNTGSGTAFSVPTIPPYQAVYVWKRTA